MDHAPERFDATPPAGEPDRPALGVLELTSIARGITVADAALKRAPSLLLMSRPVSSGKHLLMMRGQVAEVEESMIAAREIAGAGGGSGGSDSATHIKFSKRDEDGKELAGATMELRDSSGKTISTWISDGQVKDFYLYPGKYTFVETAAPDGYEVATAITFTVNEQGQVTVNGGSGGSGALLDELELPYAHEQLWRFLDAPVVADAWEEDTESVIIVETATVCAAIDSADAALKTAPVVLRDMRLAIGIAGKAFFTLTGELADVEAAAEVVRERCGARLLELACIARPVDELRGRLFF
nr:Tspycatcher [synthetic construct]